MQSADRARPLKLSPAMVPYVGLLESLKTLLKISGKTRERVALDNANYLRKRLNEIDVPFYDFGPEHNSATVSCKPSKDVEALHNELIKNKIYCSVRNGRLRVSPHFYNTAEDVDRFFDVLDRFRP